MRFRTYILLSLAALIAFHVIENKKARLQRDRYNDIGNESTTADLIIPDTVQSQLSAAHHQISKTGLSLANCAGYRQTLIPMGLAKDRDTTIEIAEAKDENIAKERTRINMTLASLKRYGTKDYKLEYKKDFRFNRYDATLLCMRNMVSDTTSVYMVFGDKKFYVSMNGTYKNDNPEALNEIVFTFLTAVYCNKA